MRPRSFIPTTDQAAPTAPFGPPCVRAKTLSTRLPAHTSTDPLRTLETLATRRPGLALLETLDRRTLDLDGPHLPSARSTLAHRPLIRLRKRGRTIEFRCLAPTAAPLLPRLASRLRDFGYEPTQTGTDLLTCDQPRRAIAEDATDDERLRDHSALDAIRSLASLIAADDDGEDEAGRQIPPSVLGAFGFDLAAELERPDQAKSDNSSHHDGSNLALVLAADFVVFDEAFTTVVSRGLPWEGSLDLRDRHEAEVSALRAGAIRPDETPNASPRSVEADCSEQEFCDRVERMKEHILDGDVFQAVLSRSITVESARTSYETYRALRRQCPSPYMFHVDLRDDLEQTSEALFGASPETFVRVEKGEVEVKPIAGTAPRGRLESGETDHARDTRLALSLLLDQKEQAEHVMLVDLGRNDLARVSKPNSTRVVELFAVEKFSQVQHLVSRVRGTLREGLDALHAYRAVANPGTLTGAPKIRAMELILAAESSSRGFYGGAIGILQQDGRFDSCIVIRSAHQRGSEFVVRSGAGIVRDSQPRQEFEETLHKARSVLRALGVHETTRPTSQPIGGAT
ncbi:MAG: anthranilate synthase component I family protein [Planctomycetota bacterium]